MNVNMTTFDQAAEMMKLLNATPETHAPTDEKPFIKFTAQGKEYFFLLIKNWLLTIVTLGVYSFWAKANIRRYLWKNTLVLGEPLEYTGTGGELFRSFLVVMVAILLAGLLFTLVGYLTHPFLAQLLFFILLMPLGLYASYTALRFRLTRTRWRGIRGNMSGSPLDYTLKGVVSLLLTMITLGIYWPRAKAKLAQMRLNNAYFGNRAFSFDGGARELYSIWLKCLCGLLAASILYVLFLVLTGMDDPGPSVLQLFASFIFISSLLVGAWFFHVSSLRWLFGNLHFGTMHFSAAKITVPSYMKLVTYNFLLTVVTLGIAYAWVHMRGIRFMLENLDYTGDPQVDTLLQDTRPVKDRGEGLLEALDVDMGF